MQKLSKVLLTVTAIFTLSGCSQQNNSQSQKTFSFGICPIKQQQ